ncbi:hypothetical protein [Roseisalinus antarcticus]|uniref:Uncharacterized protein n=1 Tax=Roseisalinus antarcticus TaxID=254357 RepID=A0A1Y5RN78_9RHOB|nr:hypothetical protein [Roseisalinus antarcticus]SLN21422.1 hypothetical protein ROA7023_00559 [Roseisalinus antarcticus]
MSDFLRPEARAALYRWREVLIAGGLAVLGLWWGLTALGILQWLGWGLVLCAAALAYAGLQRLRFAQGGGGAGVVTIDERRIVYFGPLSGGVADLDLLSRLELEPKAAPAPAWVLTLETGEALEIPIDAEGADGLFDLFAALPGIRTEQVLSVLSHRPDARVTLWQAPARRLH